MAGKKKDGAQEGATGGNVFGQNANYLADADKQAWLKGRKQNPSKTKLKAWETFNDWAQRTGYQTEAQKAAAAQEAARVAEQQRQAQAAAQAEAVRQAQAQAAAQAQQQALLQQQNQQQLQQAQAQAPQQAIGPSVMGSTANPIVAPLQGANDQTGAPAPDASLQKYQDEQMKLIQLQISNQQASYQKLFDALNAQAEQAKQSQLLQQQQYDAAIAQQADSAARSATANLNSETRFGEQQKELARQFQNQTAQATRVRGVSTQRRRLLGANYTSSEVTRR